MMRVFSEIGSLPPFRRPVVTVGSFDGVHRGHLFLLDVLRERAAAAKGESVVVTFGEHPRRVLGTGDDLRMLTSPGEKARLLEAAGVDNLVVMPFDEATSRLTAEEFVRDFLVERIGIHELVVGYNHRLGRDRSGDADLLRGLGEKYGFFVFNAPQFTGVPSEKNAFSVDGPLNDGGVSPENEKISSTAIRKALASGDIATAERLLGRKI
jgi:riboflavin kinase/FMN adenylyltransferase